MKRLILFIHGLGGSQETWGDFPEIIKKDLKLNGYDVKIYTYPTSLIRAKNIVSFFSKLLSFITPQSKLPKIQEIAQGLKTEIEHRYSEYDEIYLITHSMGGLVAKKYLIDEMNLYKRENPRVKKLLLFAVPNNGSDLARIAKFYPHKQIEQLAKDSDFIEFLNNDWENLTLESHVQTLYVIGLEDAIVDKQSSQMRWANRNLESLHKGHTDIVKPTDSDDISYLVFRNFILKELEVKKVTDNPKTENSNNQNIHITTNNTINQTNNLTSPTDDKDSKFNKIVGIATIIGVGLYISQSGNTQEVEIHGSNNTVKQVINNGMEQKEICKDGKNHYKYIINDLNSEITKTTIPETKEKLKNELKQYEQKLKSYQKNCIDGNK